jgi:hypothetical protein
MLTVRCGADPDENRCIKNTGQEKDFRKTADQLKNNMGSANKSGKIPHEMMRDAKYTAALEKYGHLKASFSRFFAERDHLIGTVKKNIEALYIIKIGKNKTKLFELQCAAARLKRKIELIQAMRNHAEDVDLENIENRLDQEYALWETQIDSLIEKIRNSKKRLSNLMPGEKSAAFQKLYRKLVKKLHPDINMVQHAYEKALWNRLTAAYASGDFEEMETIEILLENDDKSEETAFDATEKINREIEKIKEKIKAMIAEMDAANAEFPLNIKEQINDPVWTAQQNEETYAEIKKTKQHIKDLKTIVDQLIIEAINAKSIKADSKGSLDG